jgi:hypothetical protein
VSAGSREAPRTATTTLDDLLRPATTRDNVGAWRWTVRRRLVPVRDRLRGEIPSRREAWLSARHARALHERDELLGRLDHLSARVLVAPDVDEVAAQLSRLLVDIDHHAQRVHDLAYDDVELEIGGSE